VVQGNEEGKTKKKTKEQLLTYRRWGLPGEWME
jgi:hypothetical protein